MVAPRSTVAIFCRALYGGVQFGYSQFAIEDTGGAVVKLCTAALLLYIFTQVPVLFVCGIFSKSRGGLVSVTGIQLHTSPSVSAMASQVLELPWRGPSTPSSLYKCVPATWLSCMTSGSG